MGNSGMYAELPKHLNIIHIQPFSIQELSHPTKQTTHPPHKLSRIALSQNPTSTLPLPSSRTMASSTSQWNPEDVLGLGQISTGIICVSYAHSKQRRCNEPISAAKREKATKLLLQIGRQDISSPRIVDYLLLLAPLLACNRKQHQAQIPTIVEEWCNRIEGVQLKIAAERERGATFGQDKMVGPLTLQQWLALLGEAHRLRLPQLFGSFVLNLSQSR